MILQYQKLSTTSLNRRRILSDNMQFGSILPLTQYPRAIQLLAQEAVRISGSAYAPYSFFGVGAALLHEDESITAGCNYENCVYQGSCAERCAIISANAKGKRRATAVAVYGRSMRPDAPPPSATSVCPPCGICRQFLYEVAQLSEVDMDVVLVTANGEQAKVVKLSSLLPDAFGPKDLGLDLSAWGVDKL